MAILLAFLFAAVVSAQVPMRDFGGLGSSVDLGGFISFVSGEPGLRWQLEQVVESTSVPNHGGVIDMPGDSVSFGEGRFLISGKDSQTGHGWLVRMQLVLGPPRAFVEIEAVDFGTAFDPHLLYWNRAEDRIYLHDWDGQRILYASLSDWGPIPQTWYQAADASSCSALQAAEPTIILRGRREGGPGFVLADIILSARAGDGPFLIQESTPGNWTVDDLSLTPRVIPDIWGVADRLVVAANGPIEVSGAAGPFVIVDAADDTVVASGSLSAAHQYEPVFLGPAGLVPGRTYYIRDGNAQGFSPSRTFVPLLRYGAPTAHSGYEPTRVRLNADELAVGQDATPRTHVHWRGTGAAPTAPFDTFLWVGVDGPGATVDILGATVLANPILSIGPRSGAFWNEHLAFRILSDSVAIPDIPGTTLLFQFVIALPDGEVIVTDIAGSEVRGLSPASSGAARSSSGGTIDPREAAERLRRAAPPEHSDALARAVTRALLRRLASR